MPNGKPFDHTCTDIVVHGMDVFGEPIDGLVRRVRETGDIPTSLRDLIRAGDPRFGRHPDPAPLEAALRALLAERGAADPDQA